MKRKLIDKKTKKIKNNCFLCGESDYSVLDVHRINEGCNGGIYSEINTVVLCSNCHRKVTVGKIKINGKFFCSGGFYVIDYIDENGQSSMKKE